MNFVGIGIWRLMRMELSAPPLLEQLRISINKLYLGSLENLPHDL